MVSPSASSTDPPLPSVSPQGLFVQPEGADAAIIEFLLAFCGEQCGQDEVDDFLIDVAEDFNVRPNQVHQLSLDGNVLTVLICGSPDIADNLNKFEENPSESSMGDQVSVLFAHFDVNCNDPGFYESASSATFILPSMWSLMALIPLFLISLWVLL